MDSFTDATQAGCIGLLAAEPVPPHVCESVGYGHTVPLLLQRERGLPRSEYATLGDSYPGMMCPSFSHCRSSSESRSDRNAAIRPSCFGSRTVPSSPALGFRWTLVWQIGVPERSIPMARSMNQAPRRRPAIKVARYNFEVDVGRFFTGIKEFHSELLPTPPSHPPQQMHRRTPGTGPGDTVVWLDRTRNNEFP